MALLPLTPPSTLQISRHQIPPYGLIPNTSIQNKPLIIYHACIPSSATAEDIEAHLCAVGVVVPAWRYTMYSTTHFHSSSHEVLCVSEGRAELCFGHEENPYKISPTVEKGDVILVPAGVGHRLVDDFSSGFQMVGSYPAGRSWDMCYGREDEKERVGEIKGLGWFQRDPLYGEKVLA